MALLDSTLALLRIATFMGGKWRFLSISEHGENKMPAVVSLWLSPLV
jgi:hypothetical protein